LFVTSERAPLVLGAAAAAASSRGQQEAAVFLATSCAPKVNHIAQSLIPRPAGSDFLLAAQGADWKRTIDFWFCPRNGRPNPIQWAQLGPLERRARCSTTYRLGPAAAPLSAGGAPLQTARPFFDPSSSSPGAWGRSPL